MKFHRVVILTLLAIAAILAFGTFGYKLIRPETKVLDAFYMTVITVTTVGFEEVWHLDTAGRLFTVVLILLGWTGLTLALAMVTSQIVSGQIALIFGRKKVEKQMQTLEGHFIICGFGRMGEIVSCELASKSVPLVIVESDPQVCNRIGRMGFLFIQGEAGDEEVLRTVRIERARGVVATVGSDADNVFICLTARQMNQGLFILARALDEGSERKLRAAGANQVISPYLIGGKRMANAILRPHVVDLLDLAMFSEDMSVRMEQITLPEGSDMVGKSLKESGIHQDYGLIIIGIRRDDGEFHFNPGGNTILDDNDTLITMGPTQDLERLERDLRRKARHVP